MAFQIFRRFGVERLRKVFWTFALLAVFINLYDDGNIFFRNRLGNDNAAWVDKAFHQRGDFEHLITLFFSDGWKNPEVQAEAKQVLARLKPLEQEDPSAAKALDQLAEVMRSPPPTRLEEGMRVYRTAFQSVRAILDKATQARLDHDIHDDSKTENIILVANIVDLALIVLLLGVYFLERLVKEDIEQALARSVDDLRASNLRLQELTTASNRQLRIAAHDIKSPLAALKGYSEIARESTASDQPISRLLQRIDILTNSTLEMVNTLFEDAKETAPIAAVSIDKVLAEVCAASLPIAKRKNQMIEFSGEGRKALIRGNRPELLTCFYNLLNNAMKFSPEDSHIRIRWRADEAQVTVSIADEGPGFTPEDFKKIFAEGATLSARPTGGEMSSGYGLYSTKKIIEEHQGSIHIHNADGFGAVVDIELPRLGS